MLLIVETFLNPIFPIFAIMLVGIILAKRKIFDFAAAQTINKFVFYAVLPPMIFSLTASAPPAAMFSLGIIMAETRIGQVDSGALLVTAMKIIIHPLIIWLFFPWVANLDVTWSKTVLLTSAGPCGVMPFVLALQYKVKADSIGLAIVYSTVASLFTLSIIA